MHFLQHFSATIRCKLIRFFARKLLSSKNVLILKIVKIFKSSSSLIVRNIFWVILIVVRKMQWVVDAQLQCSWNFVLSAWKWKVISYQGSCLVNIIEASFITKLHCQFFLLFFLHNSWILGKVLKGEMWYIWFGLSFPFFFQDTIPVSNETCVLGMAAVSYANGFVLPFWKGVFT